MNKNKFNSRHKFLLLWFGGFIAAIGNGLTSFGLGVYVYEQTGLASATTLITLLAFLPGLLLTPFAGVLADKYDRRLLMILGDGLSALGLIFILFCMINGEAQLWQIGIGVTISSVFASLIEPAFKATISDLLSKEEYTKASGLVQISNSAKFLISPFLAGFLLILSDIKLLLILDILTLVLTVVATFTVRKGLVSKVISNKDSILDGFKEGLTALIHNKGIFILTIVGSCISFFIGCIECLHTPMILEFTDSSALGIGITVSASGMLVTSVLLGIIPIKKGFAKILSVSLFFTGIFMVGFGIRESILVICIFGFMFFAMLPFANTSLDYLIRTNIDNQLQGRIWGLIGIISQLGYVIAYATLGPLADYFFTPLLLENGALAGSVGKIIGVGSGRGIGLLIIVAGILLSFTSIILYQIKSVRELEKKTC